MNCCSEFWMWFASIGVLWWLFASMLLFYTWNQVITVVTTAKKMLFWQALLFVLTLGILFAPHHAKTCWKANCSSQFKMMEENDNRNAPALELNPVP